MFPTSSVVLCVLLASSCYCAVFRDPNPNWRLDGENGTNYKGCYVRELNDFIPLSEVGYGRGVCAKYFCSGTGELEVHTCGVVTADCPLEEDLSKPYPDCCKVPVCNYVDSGENFISGSLL